MPVLRTKTSRMWLPDALRGLEDFSHIWLVWRC